MSAMKRLAHRLAESFGISVSELIGSKHAHAEAVKEAVRKFKSDQAKKVNIVEVELDLFGFNKDE